MKDGQCPSCGCYQPDNLLCWQCSDAVATMWAAAPELIDQLQVVITKQSKIGTGGKAGKGSAHLRMPINWDAVVVRDKLLTEVALWSGDIDGVRKHPQAASIVSGLGRAVKAAYQAIDRMQDREYLGTCLAAEDDAVCHAEIWVKPGAHQVTCTQCETTYGVGERRAALLQRAADMLFTAKEASLLVGEVGHIRVTEASIRGYVHRKRIAYRPGTTLIRLGDLLAVVMDEGERRSA